MRGVFSIKSDTGGCSPCSDRFVSCADITIGQTCRRVHQPPLHHHVPRNRGTLARGGHVVKSGIIHIEQEASPTAVEYPPTKLSACAIVGMMPSESLVIHVKSSVHDGEFNRM